MLRWLYSALWYAVTPFIRRYLRKRAKKAPAYLDHWNERFGHDLVANSKAAIWVHAVSVGETRAALPLIQALRARWPDAPLLVTQMTPTGRATATDLYGSDAEIHYLPYDYPGAVRRFLECYQPKFGVLMETELWPNLIAAAEQLGIPLFLANARLSSKSLAGYRKIAWLMRPALRQLTAVAAQTTQDAERLCLLGAKNISVCGNTKFDFSPPPAQLELGRRFKQLIGSRQVIVCASTRAGEEQLILSAWQAQCSDYLLVIVPRHPERFAEVGALAQQLGYTVQYRSDQQPISDETQVWIGDSMGELFAYYRCADLVFIGGSLLPLGGQNLIEPASVGVPVLMGPSTYNFATASSQAFACGAAVKIQTADEIVVKVNDILIDKNQMVSMRLAALNFSTEHRGASQKIANLIWRNIKENNELGTRTVS